ncbi:hypothetical protein HZZ00_11125 [Streptomyces sp. NEAU-sy36]|uniref:hypothetical protein n=1 Tax=unclassified Streptomyces TaxID=2593676 RepID=UPI0015D632C4|nr:MULTISPECIES: hypothetical protein [unclassified Streptomyces]QLJ01523.1 hypothetical protein HZZ00_11125 [Streptomyces sp. NEAU-sy36]
MSSQMLEPNITYKVTMRVGDRSRRIEQDHYLAYRSPDGRPHSVDDVLLELRRACAQAMGVHVSDTYVVNCRFSRT